MADGYIIVHLNELHDDEGVFTGRMALVTTNTILMDGNPPKMRCGPEGETSPHIEHAFVFDSRGQAGVWAKRLQWRTKSDGRPATSFPEWQVRKDGDYERGECRIDHGLG